MFSKQQIRAQLFTFLFAGFETTSTAIESLLFHLGDEPEWTSKIAEEFEVGNLTRIFKKSFLGSLSCH